MKRRRISTEVLLELVERWKEKAKKPEVVDGSPGAEIDNAISEGWRRGMMDCANKLSQIVDILGHETD